MTVAEFLVWEPGDPSVRTWQLVEGEPVAMAPASDNHGSIHAAVTGWLGRHLNVPGSRYRAVVRPGVVPCMHAEWNFRVPALAVTCAPPSGRQIVPEPLILVEILSPSNETKTRSNVWTYLTIPTVREVLIVNSTRVEAELLRRGADGSWPESPLPIRPGEDIILDSIGFSVTLDALYRTTNLATPEGNAP